MQLADVIFRQRDGLEAGEDRLHHRGVARHFLFVAVGEGADLKVGQQQLDLPVAELGAFDAGRRTDALDGGDPPQAGKPLRCDSPDGSPGALELVDFGDQREDLGGDPEGGDVEVIHSSIHFGPFMVAPESPFLHPFRSIS